MSGNELDAYRRAQAAMAELKTAVLMILSGAKEDGMTNAEIGRTLGIYAGHQGHEGHISRTLLAQLEAESKVVQDASSKAWRLRSHESA